MNNYSLTSTLLQGLGKPTRRGIKKCPKCGMFNGTRGTFCKNKQCSTSLKTSQDQVFEFDAVKLVTGTFRQVYSVRVKDMILPCRGFVQLPQAEKSNMLSKVALCFVDSCQRSFDNSILKCHEEGANQESEMCSHIKLALNSHTIAKPVHFERNILNRLDIPDELKNTLRLLVADSESPLVQRVSKDVMAVKCQVAPKQPLGYLHFTFVKGRSKMYEKYYCNCMESLTSAAMGKSANIKFKCLHYYACIAALAGDKEYSEEFSHFINSELSTRNKTVTLPCLKTVKQIEPINVKRNKINIISNQIIKKPCASNKEPIKAPAKNQKYPIKRCKKIVPKIYPIEIKVLSEHSDNNKTDNGLSWPFLDWLSFVTESINKTMQFNNCGIVNTQVFYIPETFFLSFKERIPASYMEQKTSIGSIFYSIMNVNQVKEIFDTPKVKLRIAKKYVHNEQKGYVEYDENSDSDENNSLYRSSFIFFLNVGQSTVDESDNCNNAFIIEWLPNICITTQIGQLKVQYKYGRKSI